MCSAMEASSTKRPDCGTSLAMCSSRGRSARLSSHSGAPTSVSVGKRRDFATHRGLGERRLSIP